MVDGDTIHIGRNKIRLVGIDTPEIRQTCRTHDGTEWHCGVFARVLSWNGVLIFAPSPSLLKDEGGKVRMKNGEKRIGKSLHHQKFPSMLGA